MKTIYEFLLKSKTAASTQDLDYIDLGLPSGLLWASCNIGAKEPTDCGDYFMWGSTVPDTDKHCDWEHAPFNNGNNDFNKEYFKSIQNDVCPNGILAPEYDAATVILGDDWRLPTDDDFEELVDNTKYEWVKNYNDSGIDGGLFKKTDDVGLFIPASGYRGDSRFDYRGTNKGRAYLWSSSLYVSRHHNAWYIYFDNHSPNIYNSRCRWYGMCLRAVKENK